MAPEAPRGDDGRMDTLSALGAFSLLVVVTVAIAVAIGAIGGDAEDAGFSVLVAPYVGTVHADRSPVVREPDMIPFRLDGLDRLGAPSGQVGRPAPLKPALGGVAA
jgi:hypothetical protein